MTRQTRLLALLLFESLAWADAPGPRLTILNVVGDTQRVLQLDVERSEHVTIYEAKGKTLETLVITKFADRIAVKNREDPQIALYEVATKSKLSLAGTENSVPACFVASGTWLVIQRFLPENKTKIELIDVTSGKTKRSFDGVLGSCALHDDTVYFLSERKHTADDTSTGYIHRYLPKSDELRRMQSVEFGESIYGIDEIHALSRSNYFYRYGTEHAYCYSARRQPRHWPDCGHSKEQFDLTFSEDGKLAAYTERNWNELTYLVVIDLASKRRLKTTSYYAVSPTVIRGVVYFLSDPSFVQTDDPKLRQIGSYAIYSYNPKSRKMKKIMKLDGKADLF